MRTTNVIIVGVTLVAVAACGGGTMTMNPGAAGPSTNDVASYQDLALSVTSAVTTYRTSSMGPEMTSRAACQGIHDGYDNQVRPSVSQMMHLSGGMDDFMGAHGGAMSADFGCVSARMMNELDRHRLAACTSPDVSINQSEATRHADAMMSDGDHISARCGQLMNGLDGGTWNWGAMMMMDGC